MLELFRKSFLIGLGALAVSKEKIEEAVDELAAKGEMNREEARRYANELMERGKAEGEVFRQSLRKEFEKMRAQWGPVNRSDFAALEKRIAAIEEKLGITPPPAEEVPAEGVQEENTQ